MRGIDLKATNSTGRRLYVLCSASVRVHSSADLGFLKLRSRCSFHKGISTHYSSHQHRSACPLQPNDPKPLGECLGRHSLLAFLWSLWMDKSPTSKNVVQASNHQQPPLGSARKLDLSNKSCPNSCDGTEQIHLLDPAGTISPFI